jgi:deoxyadenosine/deoxycytidine kinase
MSKIKIVSIEGNIGSGKSTLRELLERSDSPIGSAPEYQIIYIDEPVSEWETVIDKNGVNIIEKFYSDQYKYAFSFQIMAYISRLASLKNAIDKNKDKNVIFVCERSMWTDRNVFAQMLYDEGKIEDINFQIYLKWFDEFIKKYPLDAMIYVTTEPALCFERILKRKRNGETIPLEYLQKCHEYHRNWINTIVPDDENSTFILNIEPTFKTDIKYTIYKFLSKIW